MTKSGGSSQQTNETGWMVDRLQKFTFGKRLPRPPSNSWAKSRNQYLKTAA